MAGKARGSSMKEQPFVITIDGTSGVGKGTISNALAKALDWHYLDSGALYRMVAYSAQQIDVDLGDEWSLVQLIASASYSFLDGAHINGECVEDKIRNEIVGAMASKVAQHTQVRRALLDLQHRFLKMPGLVADGRDMGTMVFPQALVKIYLIADAKTRAKRRFNQLLGAGVDANIAALFQDIQQRDERDMNRLDSPLKPAKDAVIIDTTLLGIGEVFEKVIAELPVALLKLIKQ